MLSLTVTADNGFDSHHDDAREAPVLSSSVGHENLHYEKNLPAPEIHRRALAARRLQGKAHHLLSRWLLDMEERGLFRELGCSSVFMYAGLHLNLEGHTVAEYLRAGRALKRFPLLAEAYEQGTLSASKLREITRVVTKETEAYWLDVARTHSTRQIEKMVVFSPRRITPPAMEKTDAAPEIADSRALLTGQEKGLFSSPAPDAQILPPGFSAGNADSSNPTMGSQDTGRSRRSTGTGGSVSWPGSQEPGIDEPLPLLHCRVPGGRPHDPAETASCSCESGTLPLPQAPDARYYVEKMVIELSAEQAAIVHNALNKARKEIGMKDRASLLTYMARVFLEGAREVGGRSSTQPPYQVVIHHHPASGAAWTEGEKGSPLVKGPVLEKVLCDADILEIPAAGGERDASGQRLQDAQEKGGTAGGEVSSTGYTYPVSINESEGEETPLEQVNRLCQAYREKASKGRRSDGAGSREKKGCGDRKSTIPRSLRKKILLRDGGRCQAPGCTRTQFLAVHHIVPQGAGGEHSLANSLVLCSGCHERVHEGRLIIEGEAPGRLTWRRV